jgi:hypothetical protein
MTVPFMDVKVLKMLSWQWHQNGKVPTIGNK